MKYQILKRALASKNFRSRIFYKKTYSLLSKLLYVINSDKNYYFIDPTANWFYDNNFQPTDINDAFYLSRMKNLREILKLTTNLDGDYLEFGVYTGRSSKIICEFIDDKKTSQKFYGFDSFKGLSEPSKKDGNYWENSDLSTSKKMAEEKLKDFSFANLIEGWLPDSLQGLISDKIAFVHFDLDLYEPTIQTLSLIYDKIVNGGVIVFDDYGFETCPGVTQAVNEFFNKDEIINLASGGTFIVKKQN